MRVKMNSFFRSLGMILVLGLCITMLSRVVSASAADNEPKLNVNVASVVMDGTYRLKVYNLTENQTVVYRSSNPSIATVSRSGRITGQSCGSATIVATVYEEDDKIATLQCDVLIGPAAINVMFSKTQLVLKVGKQQLLKTYIIPINTVETPIFYSTDLSVASISSAGRVRAKEAGTVQVYAMLQNGQSAMCEVTVLSAEDYLRYRDGESLEDILAETEDPEESGSDSGSTASDVATGSSNQE